jgi:formate dehydrogenase subunit gamma
MSATVANAWDPALAEQIIGRRLGLQGALLPILHDLQAMFGCIPAEAIPPIAEALNLSRAEVHGVVTFYHDFRESPTGRRLVRACRGEACQSMGGASVGEPLLRALGIAWGETTADGEVTVEPVYCLGLCAVAPAALVDGEPVGRATAEALLARLKAHTR